jgi:ADP-heptose:LPS heptosyltransferase
MELDVVIHAFPNRAFARLAKKAKIPLRIGTSHRIFHWLTCNKLVHFTRKKSPLHESQLNFQLLAPLVPTLSIDMDKMHLLSGFRRPLKHPEVDALIDQQKFNLILHPKSKGSAREWGLDRFSELIELLPQEQYHIIITGTEEEGKQFRDALVKPYPHVRDASGRLSLSQLISLIADADALIACSTGPLHIAAALGINAIGIYPPIKPMHPGRWAPIGLKTKVFVKNKTCNACSGGAPCDCIKSITPHEIASYLSLILG